MLLCLFSIFYVLPLPSRTTREDCRVSCTEWQSVLYFVLPKLTPSAPYLDASARTFGLRPRKPHNRSVRCLLQLLLFSPSPHTVEIINRCDRFRLVV